MRFRRAATGTFIYSEEDTCRQSFRIVSTGLLISQTTTIAVGEEMDRGEGEETREEVNLEEESSRICLLVGGRKIARSSGAAPQESSGKREKSATSGETSGDVD